LHYIILIFFLSAFESLPAQIYIDSTVTYLKGGANINVKPGDTVYLRAGHKPYLLLEDIHGKKDSVVVFINYGGTVIINTTHYFGITTKNCTYFRITGSGDQSIAYGIDIQKVENGSGIGISSLSNHFEIDHIRIANTLLAGIYAKTDPDTTFRSVRDSFLMEDVFIHHNLLYNIRDEGMYIGSTKYFGQHITYRGKDTLLFPHLLHHVDISFNKIINTGWDGIQLSSASQDAVIHDNMILNDSYRDYPNQMSGIMVGGGTKADCYNNYISGGHGCGIVLASLGGQRIFNNIIINAGRKFYPSDLTQMQHGIYVDDITVEKDSSFYIFNNLIYQPKSDGIRFRSLLSKNNKIANNVIIKPGNYGYYDTLNTSFNPQDAFIMLTDKNISVDTFSNQWSMNCNNLGFTDTLTYDFTLLPSSPLIDAGADLTSYGILFDIYNHTRPYGTAYDIGPFEFNAVYLKTQKNSKKSTINIFPNPASTSLIIRSAVPLTNPEISIFNISGQEVKTDTASVRTISPFSVFVDIESLKNGIYFIRIVNGNKVFVEKFIVN
jgi:hypothetical protein